MVSTSANSNGHVMKNAASLVYMHVPSASTSRHCRIHAAGRPTIPCPKPAVPVLSCLALLWLHTSWLPFAYLSKPPIVFQRLRTLGQPIACPLVLRQHQSMS